MKRKKKMISSLTDTSLLMCSDDWRVRFVGEYWQLRFRLVKFREMVESYEARKLPFNPKCKLSMLKRRLRHMEKYLYDLEVEAKINNISLVPDYVLDMDLITEMLNKENNK